MALEGSSHRPDIVEFIESMPVAALLGIRLVELSSGHAEYELTIQPEVTFDGSVVQGGIVGTLADFAGVTAAMSALDEGWFSSTVDFQVQNLAPAVGERLVAVGESLRSGRRIGLSRADVWAVRGDERVLCATALTTSVPIAPRASGE
ncbi:MAG: PaaI family thioesterase [Dehalococcoidia bacterium]|jgi:uncharacterized protein (TIGR00369 family)|nr:PaaI family thioesterase [Dehalococcoidia bacterium]